MYIYICIYIYIYNAYICIYVCMFIHVSTYIYIYIIIPQIVIRDTGVLASPKYCWKSRTRRNCTPFPAHTCRLRRMRNIVGPNEIEEGRSLIPPTSEIRIT